MSSSNPRPAAPHAPVARASDDAEILNLGRQFDEAHAVWRRTVEAYRAPSAQYAAIIQEARDQGGPAMADHERAEAVPGWRQSHDEESDAFASLGEVALDVLRSMPLTVSGLAVLARAVIPHVWATGSFEADGALGNEENIDRQAVRFLVDACLSLAGVDWKGNAAKAYPPPSASLAVLARDLEACDAAYEAADVDDDALNARLRDEVWRLRETISEAPVSSIGDLRVKALAARAAFDRDQEANCVGPGSFVGLSLSIINDLARAPSPN